MRISDWSSDVCSSDLLEDVAAGDHDVRRGAALLRLLDQPLHLHQRAVARTGIDDAVFVGLVVGHFEPAHHVAADRLYASTIAFMQPGSPIISSSARKIANGSSPTISRAHHTAWPSPSGSCWRT